MKKDKKTIASRIMTIAVFILTASLIIELIVLGVGLRQGRYRYTVDAISMVYSIRNGDYENLVRDYYNNLYQNVTEEKNKDYIIPYAVARYVESAIKYRVYAERIDAAECISNMENDKQLMGEFAYIADDIDERLGIGREDN